MAEDPHTLLHTSYIKFLRDNKKRKHKIEAERKQMEKQKKNARLGQFLPAIDLEATASTIE
jgi:hypothetical protein